MTRPTLLACLLAVVFSHSVALADAGRVIVVQPATGTVRAWPAATRAAVAELALAGFEVTVRRSARSAVDQMLFDLRAESGRSGVVAAVLITRTDTRGSAHVWLHGSDTPLLISEYDPDGAVAQGAITLKLTELLRERSLQLPALRQPDVEPLPEAGSADDASPSHTVATPWLGLGAVWSKQASLAPLVAVGTQLRLPRELSFDLKSTLTLTPMNVRSEAGTAELEAASFGVHLLFDPWRSQALSVAVGAGASALWVRSRAVPADGYVGLTDTAAVGVVAATARVALRRGPLGLQLLLEPGIAVPPVRVLAGNVELTRLGRPVVVALLGVSWDL